MAKHTASKHTASKHTASKHTAGKKKHTAAPKHTAGNGNGRSNGNGHNGYPISLEEENAKLSRIIVDLELELDSLKYK